MTEESRDGPTPNGGVKSTAFYQDAEGKPAEKGVATNVLIVEYDEKGNSIHRTYGTLGPQKATATP